MSLDSFIHKISEFDKLSASNKIDYFVYYLTITQGQEGVKSKDVDSCFDQLKAAKYSNTGQYLRSNSKKSRTRAAKFVFQKGLYHLERTRKTEIDVQVNAPRSIAPSNDYFPIELFNNTRGYLVTIASQAASCYDNSLFDACSVITRKLLEVLIIEAFERYKIESKIKNSSGNFLYLSDLIDAFKADTTWNIGRNVKDSLPKLKKMGDLSAHNRRYIAKKPDVDKLKDDLRIVLEELVHLIDYPNWK